MMGRIVSANAAFVDLAQLSSAKARCAAKCSIAGSAAPVSISTLRFANLKQSGSVRLFSTMLRGDLSVAQRKSRSPLLTLADGDERPGFGFAIRNVDKRLSSGTTTSKRELPRSVAQLTELIGRVPLRDLVRETTDVIEKLSIEAALELTGDNRASAAEMLGLSRQSLYVKLRRFGLAEPVAEGEAE